MGINIDHSIPTGANQIHAFVAEYFPRGDSTDVNRASAATLCVRRRWYQARGFKGTVLDSRKVLNFFMGQIAEHAVQFWIKKGCVGDGKLYREANFGTPIGALHFQGKEVELYEQKTFSFQLQEHKITAHADGLATFQDGTNTLIEIKSASSYGFDEFVKNGPGDYLKQAHALMLTDELRALNVKHVHFYFKNKQNGDIHDKIYPFDEGLAKVVKKEYLQAQSETIPPDPYGFTDELYRGKPTGRTTIPWQCQYCPFTETCKGKFSLEFKYGKPKYYFNKEIQNVST